MSGHLSTPYAEAKDAFIAWCNKNDFDPNDWELWTAFLAGVDWAEGNSTLEDK